MSSVSFSYGENNVLDDISLEITNKDFIAIIGPNGSGKTTLVKIMLGLLSPDRGTVTRLLPTERIGYVPQRYALDQNFPGTVEELLAPNNAAIIKQVGIKSLLKKKFISLSVGQQQRLLIALALQKKPDLLILDEPTAGVDVKARKSFYALLKKLNKSGIAILLISHEVGIVSSVVKKVLCVNHTICCIGHPKEMPKLVKEMYGGHRVHQHKERRHHA